MDAQISANVKIILDRKGISITAVGKKLFPTNQYPYAAMNRAFKGQCQLKADQISKLSELTGIPVEELCPKA